MPLTDGSLSLVTIIVAANVAGTIGLAGRSAFEAPRRTSAQYSVNSGAVSGSTHALMEVWLDHSPSPTSLASDFSADLFDRVLIAEGGENNISLPRADYLSLEDGDTLFGSNGIVGAKLTVTCSDEQRAAMALVGSVEWVCVDAGGDRDGKTDTQPMIVAENLIAAADGTGTKIAARVRTPADVQGAEAATMHPHLA